MRSGSIGTPDGGRARVTKVALFVHGVFLNGELWRELMLKLGDRRRCIAVDLFCHGRTRYRADQDLSYTRQVEMLESFCEALEIDQVDLGFAVKQYRADIDLAMSDAGTSVRWLTTFTVLKQKLG